MKKFDPNLDYSMRMYNSIIQSIKEYIELDQLQKTDKNKWKSELDKIPVGDDEAAKIYRDMKFDDNEIEKIKKITKRIIKEKEKRDDKKKKEEEKEFDNKIKVAAKSFSRDYIDFAEEFYSKQQFFFDNMGIWWLWDNKNNFWEIIDETTLLNEIYDSCKLNGINITTSSTKSEITTSMKMVGRKHKPKESPTKWIQFKDKAFSLESGKTYEVTPDYFFTNPIPWEMGKTSNTPTMDKLFEEWVGKDYVKTLYEILAYCCYRDYPMHMCFCFIGGGRNGKSQFQKIVSRFIGQENITSSSLDMIKSNRFETFKMYRKLVCLMGETNFGLFDDTDTFKRITGGDPISYEKKGKDGFIGFSYATILINSNSLPITQDTSEGFYRRWFIIDFPNNFPEGKDIINTIPEEEYNNLSRKITEILPKLLDKAKFHNQGSIDERKDKYIEASNPITIFFNDCCDIKEMEVVKSSELYAAYTKYLKHNKKRLIKRREFSTLLAEEGYIVEKQNIEINGAYTNTYFVLGLKLKDNWDDFSRNSRNSIYSTLELSMRDKSKDYTISTKLTKINEEKVFLDEELAEKT